MGVERTERAWLDAPVESGPRAGFGVYLHVPFCHHRCGYCDFATVAVGDAGPEERRELGRRYVTALRRDLALQVARGPAGMAPGRAVAGTAWPTVTSVFVGGGTPTLLEPEQLRAVVTAVGDELDVAGDVEVTVECNPETADPGRLGALAEAGVTRLSVGAQSFREHVLATLERGHDPGSVPRAVALAREAGIEAVSLDVIFGTPGESEDDWRHTLSRVRALEVDHVSAYALTVHDNTSFGRRVAAGALPAPDPDRQRDFFDLAREVLAAAGHEHYEISNFARGPARRSRHNGLYWRHGDYLGVGVGAHAHLAGRRWWSTRSVDRYLDAVGAVDAGGAEASRGGPLPWISGAEELDDAQRADERLLLGLRLREGLHPADLPPIAPMALEDALDAGLVETACGRLRCTEQGWFLLDEAVARLLS